ncbi:MAG TPA: valine--tRNA ligase [Candidatus Hydrogenedentes bacterium]|nr:valine--tRNA ligase [Candidatus Hydrogenedentota bacterium]
MDLPKKYKPHAVEASWKNAWGKSGIYAWDPNRPREETFVVDTPPPTVSGSLHLGHLFSYSHQDFIVRYQRMRGKNIFFPIGWDDNGLPTERRVQNLMNVKCSTDVPYDPDFKGVRLTGKAKTPPEPISRKNFVELCDDVVVDDEEVFKALWTRLGLSYDWDQEYTTIGEHSRRISQYSFLKLLEDDEIYQAERPVLWDVDFQTAIAQAELKDKELPSAYQYLNFGVDGSDTKLVIATTRPELLPACVAVAVHPDDERYKEYVGQEAVTPLFGVKVRIIADVKADPEKGTGVVMICTFGDQTDVEWWTEYKLPTRQILNREGHLIHITFGDEGWESVDADKANAVYEKLSGKYVKPARRIIVEEAEAAGNVIARPQEDITHSVKFFEKGDRPLELIPARQWYTKLMDKKQALIEQGQKIKWHPEYMYKRYEHWVEGLNQDWCLSRQRFFGVPIPVWYKIDEHGETQYDQRALPSVEQLPVDPLGEVPEGYTEEQRNQPNGFSGDPDIFDTWATSSLSPQISSHWFLDEERHAKLYPADMRPQGHDIIRTWAFYTIVKAYLHDKEVPWTNITLSGWILDPDRKKMSKSQGNVVTPEPMLDEFGADSVRYWAGRARLGVDTAHDEQVFKVGKRLCMKMFNASKFVIDRFGDIDPALLGPEKVTVETDRVAIAQLRPLIERATAAFDDFDYSQALQRTEDFFWAMFCDNYIELAKPRTYDEELSVERLSAASSLRLIHRALVRMLAPFVPFITDEVWHWAYSGDADMHDSVHRSPWPTLSEFASIPEPSDSGTWAATMEVVDAVRKAKANAQMSVKAPVESLQVTHTQAFIDSLAPALGDLMEMLRIETVDLLPDEAASEIGVEVEMKETENQNS